MSNSKKIQEFYPTYLASYLLAITMSRESGRSETFKQGIKIRREVLGDAYVDKALAGVRIDPRLASAGKSRCFFTQQSRVGLPLDRAQINLQGQDRNISRKCVGRAGAAQG